MSPEAWLKAQADSYRALAGVRISEWRGCEEALDDGADGYSPVWRHPSADALQFARVQLVTTQAPVTVCTAQGYDAFGLYRPDAEIWPQIIAHNAGRRDKWASLLDLEAPSDPRSIMRNTRVPSLPVGTVEQVQVSLSEARTEIEEVVLDICGARVSLRAAEFRRQASGEYCTSPLDECVLIQIDRRHPEKWCEA